MQNPTQQTWILEDSTLACGVSLKCASKQEKSSEFPLLQNTTRILKSKLKIITVVSHISEVGVFTFINTHEFEYKWIKLLPAAGSFLSRDLDVHILLD